MLTHAKISRVLYWPDLGDHVVHSLTGFSRDFVLARRSSIIRIQEFLWAGHEGQPTWAKVAWRIIRLSTSYRGLQIDPVCVE